MTANGGPILVTTAEINTFCRNDIKQAWPAWKAKYWSIKKDSHGNSMSYIVWLDHVTEEQMRSLVGRYGCKSLLGGEPALFERDNKSYASRTLLHYHRVYTRDFLQRVAVIFCRRHQVPLPEVCNAQYYGEAGAKIRQEQNEPHVDGHPLSKAIMLFAATIDEDGLKLLEAEAGALTPLQAVTPDVQRQREEAAEERSRSGRLRTERTRQSYQILAAVWDQLPAKSALLADVQDKASALGKRQRKLTIDLYEPVTCMACGAFVEQEDCTRLERPLFAITFFVCNRCIEQFPMPPIPQNVLDEERALDKALLEAQEEPYHPSLGEDGLYIAKNGEAMPVLTRDLLHNVRVSKSWLWFGEDTPEKMIPSQEIRDALYKAGWRWGNGRKQYHTSNPYGVLTIPELVYREYGGYVDGGFCDYRSTRGQRLRAYAADQVDPEADAMQAWSNDIVAKYMATGSLVLGGRRTRKLLKERERAEKKATEAKRLDAYARDMRRRANSSERYQAYLASDEMLPRRLQTLEKDLRKLENDFTELVEDTARAIHAPSDLYQQHSVRYLIHYYHDYVEPRKDILQEEINLIHVTIQAREEGREEEPETPEPVPVPERKERTFAVQEVVEVHVGRENASDLFPTHPDITRFMLDKYPIPHDSTVLEPHGGTEAMLRVIREHLRGSKVPIYTYEIIWDLNQRLRQRGYIVLGLDFLQSTLPPEIAAQGGFGDVCMNSPFHAWEKHLLQAWKQGRPGCRIRAILPAAAPERSEVFATIRKQAVVCEITPLPADAFKVSGTMVRTCLVYLVKPPFEQTVSPAAPVVEPQPSSAILALK